MHFYFFYNVIIGNFKYIENKKMLRYPSQYLTYLNIYPCLFETEKSKL